MKILIADDEALIRRSLRRVLEFEQYEVLEADNGLMAFDLWVATDPDLVILDVLMPGLTGPQVLQKIAKSKRAKVILISAYTGDFDSKKANEIGADIFVPKPFTNVFDFVTIVAKLLADTTQNR